MSNNQKRESIFHFKQFQVKNELSAMKVGTDGVLLGAWMDITSSKNILDIGTGSGIIALMAAQRSNAFITAIEIDNLAAQEAQDNISISPWRERITIINDDFLKWVKNNTDHHLFDHIVSNPPFFSKGLSAPDSNRAMARHGNGLNYDVIISSAKSLLTADGRLSLISPVERKDDILFSADIAKMKISRITEVSSKIGNMPVRLLWEMTTGTAMTNIKQLNIRNVDGTYSDEYITLTKDFYLNM